MKKFTVQAIALLIVAFLALAVYTAKIPIPSLQTSTPSTASVIIGNTTIKVDVADTSELRSRGLGGRDSLAQNSGMLFIFQKEDKYPFWMKGLNFPLDFIWIRKNTVVDLLPNIKPPTPGQSDQSLTIYAPKVPVDMVLEVPAGTTSRLGVAVGDKVEVTR